MKKWCIVAVAAGLLLSGCGTQTTFETIADEVSQQVLAVPREMKVQLPSESAVFTMESPAHRTLYDCDGYIAATQSLPGGDVSSTLKEVTGYTLDQLKPVETEAGVYQRYDFVCTMAGENGDEVCRGTLIDDGSYHYVLTLTAQAEQVHDLEKTWKEITESFMII